MSRLTTLSLGSCGLTDDGAKQLVKLTALEVAEAARTGAHRSHGARHLPNLEKLTLESALITDAALPELVKL